MTAYINNVSVDVRSCRSRKRSCELKYVLTNVHVSILLNVNIYVRQNVLVNVPVNVNTNVNTFIVP